MAIFEHSETQLAVQEVARTFARQQIAPLARELDAQQRFPAELLREMASIGLMGVNVPEALGGAGAGAVSYALAMMEIAQADASTAVTMAVTNMVAETIVAFGSEAQKERYVPRLCSGEYQAGSFALSEPHCGSDPADLRCTATPTDKGWVLNGEKQWITSGAHAGVMVVWARTSNEGARGLSAFLVEGGSAGLSAGKPEEKMGLLASNTVSLSFDGVEIPKEALLGQVGGGFRIAMSALDGGRVGIGSQSVGLHKAALVAAREYAKERKAFGQAISDFQATQFKLADMATELDAARLLVLRAAALKEQGLPFTREASMAKLFASEAANRAVAHAVQIHGGYGYVKEFEVERYYRDARVTTIYEGTSEIQRLVIARDVLKNQSRPTSRI